LFRKLIIFDYSGTLSLEMAEFAEPDNLMHHLQESGLFTLGVKSAALFWEIINATWEKGSTTNAGYKKVFQDGIYQLFPETARSGQTEVVTAVANFTDAYFKHSPIDPHWRPVLEKVNNNKSVHVIIATDHYAEATDTIINCFDKWKIQATTANVCDQGNYIVANSADIGVHKAERKFWETIKNKCGISANQILLIDDFGANEQSADAYAQTKEISQRREKTINLLENVFSASVECFSFAGQGVTIADLVAQTSAKITQFFRMDK
jgi:hypothetical protein